MRITLIGIKIITSVMKKGDGLSKLQNRYTQESEATSEESCEFTGGFLFNLLPAPNKKNKFAHFQGIPSSQTKIRQSRDPKKPSILLPTESADNQFLSIANQQHQKEGSFIDIRVSNYPSNDQLDSVIQLDDSQNIRKDKSSTNLRSSQKIENNQLRKSGTEPKFMTLNQYEGYSIKTNLVANQKNFKKQKEKVQHANLNSTVSFLNPSSTPKTKRLDASRIINESRITLKDYLFMASTSAKKAAESKRRELEESRKLEKTESNKNYNSQQSNGSQSKVHLLRQRFHKEKYMLDNHQMGIVVRQEISKEIISLESKIQTIKKWLGSHQKIGNDELVQMYSLRRDLQEYNTKFEDGINQLGSNDIKMFVSGVCNMFDIHHSENDNESEIGQLAEI